MSLEKEEKIKKKIRKLCEQIAKDILEKNAPSIEFLTRGGKNIVYDDERDIILIGNRKSSRSLLDLGEAKKFLQTIKTLERSYMLLSTGQHDTTREFYYTLKFPIPKTNILIAKQQRETDSVIYDLEVALGVLREEMHFTVDRAGAMVGPITLIDRSIKDEVYEIDCSKTGRGGIAIPSTVEEIDLVLNSDPEDTIVLAVETGGMFERLLELKFWRRQFNKLNKDIILILTKGQAKRSIRRLIHRLHTEFKLPVYVFTDADPWGYYIFSVIKHGSKNLSYLSKFLATPDARFIGMTLHDAKHYGLWDRTEPLSKTDIKRLKEELEYEWFKKDKRWVKELKFMLKEKKRIEQQALSAKGIDFVAKTYLPEKLEKIENQ